MVSSAAKAVDDSPDNDADAIGNSPDDDFEAVDDGPDDDDADAAGDSLDDAVDATGLHDAVEAVVFMLKLYINLFFLMLNITLR